MNFKYNKTDGYLLVVLYIIAAIVSVLSSGNDPNLLRIILAIIDYIVLSAIAVYILIYVIFAKFFPERKLLPLIFWMVLLLLATGTISICTHCYYFKGERCNPFTMHNIALGFVMEVNDVGIIATLLLGKKLFEAQLDFFKIEKEKKENELRLLQSQIDPHFLFNNLNTVDAIIDKDPKMAKNYLNKLAQLYRYLITSKDSDIVSLKDELAFAKNYIYLIENRFGTAFQFNIKENISAEEEILIPPGALQTLLENVVKHNRASSENPIKTTIIINEKNISIRNNIIKKYEKVDSTDTGLKNLEKRYKLLTDEKMQIEKGEYFVVKIPVIKQVS